MKKANNKFDAALELVGRFSIAGMAVMLMLAILTMWAMNRSQERAACYRTASSVDACLAPNMIERVLASVIGLKTH